MQQSIFPIGYREDMAKGLKVCQVKIPVSGILKLVLWRSVLPAQIIQHRPVWHQQPCVCTYKVYMGKVYCYVQHF